MYLIKYILVILACLLFNTCIQIEEYDNTPRGNFEALWKILDERYCFFEYKEIDWHKVHDDYSQRITNNMGDDSLFYLLNKMLQELKDGHVNLFTSFDVGRYWKWFEEYPSNFNSQLIDSYLGSDYLTLSGIKYKILNDNIGYMYYGDFSIKLGEGSLDQIIDKFANCDGIIIDVRDNSGGLLSNSTTFASRFVNERKLVGYIQHKTGKGHNDFSSPYPKYIEPYPGKRYQKSVVVLTNRKCYSTTNDFVNSMRLFPNVTIVGDKTGGGGGLPFSSEIPNGWSVRFSACPNLGPDKEQIEFGIDPDIKVNLLEKDALKKRDTLIETARELIRGKT